MKITKTQLRRIIKEELEAVSEQSQYEAGSAGYHIEQAIRMSKDLDELEQAMPKPIRIKYASGLGLKIEEELAIALEVMDNTIDSYKSDLFDARGDDDPGYGMIDDRDQLDEAHGLSKADAKTLKDFAKDQKGDIKRIINFLVKSNVEVDKTQDVTKMKKKESKK
jgi:hypothetical protein